MLIKIENACLRSKISVYGSRLADSSRDVFRSSQVHVLRNRECMSRAIDKYGNAKLMNKTVPT